jgi:hypothetical protein
MLAAATIPFDPEEQSFTLEELREHLAANLPYECTLTEWQGFDAQIPQVRVATAVPLTVQIDDDPGYVPEELSILADEAAGVLADEWVELLRRCTARLDVMEADVPLPEPGEDGAIHLHAQTRLDPAEPGVEAVLIEVARFVDSLVHDDVNGEWLVPEGER